MLLSGANSKFIFYVLSAQIIKQYPYSSRSGSWASFRNTWKVRVVVSERREEESSKAASLQARQEKFEALRKLMEEDSINPEELMDAFSSKSSSPKKVR